MGSKIKSNDKQIEGVLLALYLFINFLLRDLDEENNKLGEQSNE